MAPKITSVDAHSPAEQAGIAPGDCLHAIDGHVIRDVLDYKFYGYDPEVTLTLETADGGRRTVLVRKREGQDLGLNFESYLMDKAKRCSNHCVFCFIDQLPRGMRETLYFKDDDARMSFLMGNYISMTNMSDEDIDRMIRMHISPVNVSVQVTDPECRVKMLRNPKAGRLMPLMRRFAEAGITMNDVNPDYVVVGEGRSYSLDTLTKATNLVMQGAKLIGANSDVSGPIENGIAPACRALIAPIEMATGKQAYFCGKPNPLMMRTGLKMLNCHSAEAVMVGDRMDTDVISGMESGMSTVLVLSGVSTRESLRTYAYRPSIVLDGVGDIAAMARAEKK